MILGADEALMLLKEGNRRFVEDRMLHPNLNADRRAEVARQQSPFAVVLGCSDSRVPAELVFDRGIGDLFVVRLAGNVAGTMGMASLEFAVEYLRVPLIVVLGHERCGAVQAALDFVDRGTVYPGQLKELVNTIQPAAEAAQGATTEERLESAIKRNVVRVVRGLEQVPPVLASYVRSGKLKIVGGYCDLDTGEVEFLDTKS
ncbi:MAG: carbonic anhydrase [Anaerolineae bacterium]